MLVQLAEALRCAMDSQVGRCGAEDQSFVTERTMAQGRRPDGVGGDTHGHVDTRFDKVDAAVGERQMRPQRQMALAQLQEHRQHLQTADGDRHIAPQTPYRLMLARRQSDFGLVHIRQDLHAGAMESGAGTLNVSAANAGIGMGAILGGVSIEQLGLPALGLVAAAVATVAALLALRLEQR